jgi:hypothetical protein
MMNMIVSLGPALTAVVLDTNRRRTRRPAFSDRKVIAILLAMPLRSGYAPKNRRLSREYYSVC